MFDVLELMNLFVNNVRSSLFETNKFKNRQHRIINDLCLYCDMFDHKIIDCLNKFKRRDFQIRAIELSVESIASIISSSLSREFTSSRSKNV